MSLDKVILMNKGHFVYYGPPDKTLDYMRAIGFRHPKFVNPADYVLKVAIRPDLANPMSGKCIEREYLQEQYNDRLADGILEQIERSSDIVNHNFDFDMIQKESSANMLR